MAFFKELGKLFTGSPAKARNVSTLLPEQTPLYNQAVNAGLMRGAGGAFGDTADYYRNLLSNDNADFDSFAAPELRSFREDIIPGLAEQFAGMGSGGLSSSGFRNAAINAGTDLSERLGAIRARLRQQGAQGLSNIGQMGLNPYSQMMTTQQGSEGILPGLARGVGQAIPGMIRGGFGG